MHLGDGLTPSDSDLSWESPDGTSRNYREKASRLRGPNACRTKCVCVMRERCRFRQSEVTRAVKATLAAGVEVDRVEIEKDGRVIVVCKQKALDFPTEIARNPWDEVLNDAPDEKRSA